MSLLFGFPDSHGSIRYSFRPAGGKSGSPQSMTSLIGYPSGVADPVGWFADGSALIAHAQHEWSGTEALWLRAWRTRRECVSCGLPTGWTSAARTSTSGLAGAGPCRRNQLR